MTDERDLVDRFLNPFPEGNIPDAIKSFKIHSLIQKYNSLYKPYIEASKIRDLTAIGASIPAYEELHGEIVALPECYGREELLAATKAILGDSYYSVFARDPKTYTQMLRGIRHMREAERLGNLHAAQYLAAHSQYFTLRNIVGRLFSDASIRRKFLKNPFRTLQLYFLILSEKRQRLSPA